MKLQFLLSAYLLIMAYQVSQKYVECLKSYGVDMILWQMWVGRRGDSQTPREKQYVSLPL